MQGVEHFIGNEEVQGAGKAFDSMSKRRYSPDWMVLGGPGPLPLQLSDLHLLER